MKRVFFLVPLFLFWCGCAPNYSGYSNRYSAPFVYSGISRHLKQTTGQSNLSHKYPNPPILDPNDPLERYRFESKAREYLAAVVNDLEEIGKNAANANEKIRGVVDAANSGLDHFSVRPVGPIIHIGESNLGFLGYPEFPRFDYWPPFKPVEQLDSVMIDSYNKEVADFLATIKDYIADATHYVRNCQNDYEEIHQKGLTLLNCLDSLDMDMPIDLQ